MGGANTFPHVIPVASLAEMAGLHLAELDFGVRVFVIALLQNFYLLPSSPIAANGVTVVAPVAGAAAGKAAALWVNESVIAGGGANVTVSPKGGGLDDWPTVIGLANALAYKGAVSMIGSATPYLCKTKVYLVSGATIVGNPGVSAVCSLGNAGGVDNAPFASIGAAAGITTLAATPTLGASTISVVGNVGGAIVVGATVMPINSGGLRALSYLVRAISGAGPYTVTLDRPLRMAFTSGDNVNVYAAGAAPADITIEGRGMRISGTFSRAFELSPSRRGIVSGLVVDASASNPPDLTISFDGGGFENKIVNCEVDGGNAKSLGIALESDEASTICDCVVTRTTGGGVMLLDCVDCEVTTCVSSAGLGAGATGFQISADGNTLGSLACRMRGCTATGNGQYGFLIGNGSSDCEFIDCVATSNVSDGFLGDGTGGGFGNAWIGCISRANGAQFVLGAGCLSARYIGCEGSRGVGFFAPGWNINASCTMDGCTTVKGIITEGDTGVLVSGAGTVVTMTGCRITPYYGFALSIGAGARVLASACIFATTDPTNPVIEVTGELDSSNLVILSGGTGVNVHAAGIFRRTGLFDASACSVAAITVAGGGFVNVGTINLNGATPVSYMFPVLTTDAVYLVRKTAGGTPGAAPTYTVTAGTSVNLTGTVADTSLYEVVIGP